MSMPRRFGRPVEARQRRRRPIVPPTGPESSVWIGCSRALRAVVMPPFDCITCSVAASLARPSSSSSASRYLATRGAMYALSTAEEARSYSRHSRGDLVRQRHREARALALEDLADAQLVRRVE